jgi:hypothetical protein
MKDFTGCVRGFHHSSAAWYASSALIERDVKASMMIGMYHCDGGTMGEFSIKWYALGERPASPRLEVFDDALAALAEFVDVLDALQNHDNQKIQPLRMCELLRGLGIKDLTQYTQGQHYEQR